MRLAACEFPKLFNCIALLAYFKSQEAAGSPLPLTGTVFISVADQDKARIVDAARKFAELGSKVKATNGTCKFLQAKGVPCELIYKIHEHQRTNVADEIKSRAIDLVINTPMGKTGAFDDAYIRQAAIKYKVPYLTTTSAAKAAVQGIAGARLGKAGVKSLQEYHSATGRPRT